MKNIVLLLCLVTITFSCSDDNDNVAKEESRPPVGETRGMTVADANSLLVIGSPVPYGRAADVRPAYTPNVYKVTEDGSVKVVEFMDAQGNVIDTEKAGTYALVRWMTPVGNDYLALTGDFVFPDSVSTKQYRSLLVRKSDGAIYDFTQGGLIPMAMAFGEQAVKTDGKGSLYYLASDNGAATVKKLAIADPAQPTISAYTPAGQQVENFEIDAQGNCLYKYGRSAGVTGSNGTADLRIRKADGSIFEIKVEGRDNREAWLGANGSFYFISYAWEDGYRPAIHRIDIAGSEVVVSTVWSTEDVHLSDVVGSMMRSYNRGAHIIRKENSVVFVDTYTRNLHWEFFENDNTVRALELPKIDPKALLVHSLKHYYIVMDNELYKVDLDAHTYGSLLPPNAYEIYSIDVDAEDVVRFSGLRISDRRSVVAEISAAGTLTILSEAIALPAVVMQRM